MEYLKTLNEAKKLRINEYLDFQKNVHTEMCIQMFTAALFIIAKCPSIDK